MPIYYEICDWKNCEKKQQQQKKQKQKLRGKNSKS